MKFLLTLFVTFIIVTGLLYIFVQKNQTAPDKNLIAITQDIPKYPNSTSWEVNTGKNFCMDKLSKCGNSASITFTTGDSWNIVYGYYRTNMGSDNWGTNSQVFTSIPETIVFIKNNCEADIAPTHKFLGGVEKQKFNFQISCDTAQPVL